MRVPNRLLATGQHHRPSHPTARTSTLIGLALAGLLGGCGGDNDDPPASQPLASACPAFAPAGLPHDAKLLKTELREAVNGMPRACIVRGEIKSSEVSTITWAVELPEGADWNGKTLTVGGGGMDGFIPTDDPWYHTAVMGPSSVPFVRISSNSGHWFSEDVNWINDAAALKNHAYEANHLVLEVGVRLAELFYGRTPTHRYMIGQSNGGRSGLMAASRYPNDYHGIVAFAPAISQQAHQVNMGPNNRWAYGARGNWMSPGKTALFAAAEIRACDALDGLKDGVIGNAEACTYVPNDLRCADDAAGATDDSCLTSGQIEAIRINYADKTVPLELANGMTGYQRYGRGGAATGDWIPYAFGDDFDGFGWPARGFSYIAPTAFIQALTGDPTADSISHDPLTIPDQWRALSDVMEPAASLSAFGTGGGKLLVWYGIADTCVSAYRTAAYLDMVRQDSGDALYQSYARFVTSPAVGHDFTGPGAAPVDMLKTMMAWVENGTAPDNLVGAHTNDQGQVEFERPLCPYPAYAHYNGTGDPKLATSFSCKVNGAP